VTRDPPLRRNRKRHLLQLYVCARTSTDKAPAIFTMTKKRIDARGTRSTTQHVSEQDARSDNRNVHVKSDGRIGG
jgi:hypothetical protein